MKIIKDKIEWEVEANFNVKEKSFIKDGKRIWTVAQADGFWALAAIQENDKRVMGKFETQREAELYTLSFANLQENKERHAVYHKIKRPDDWPDDYLIAK